MSKAIRDLLAASKLEAFKEWVMTQDYEVLEVPHASVYEVLRIRKRVDSGKNNPYIIFHRKTANRAVKYGAKESTEQAFHITVPKDAYQLVRRFIQYQRGLKSK